MSQSPAEPGSSTQPSGTDSITVVGAGISGLAAAHALVRRGAAVRVVERGRVAGGRMASRRLDGRPVDLGASYFTAKPGTRFAAQVDSWLERGLAREWTDTFSVATPDGVTESKTGPMRYGAAAGLRSLVEDLARGVDVELETPLDRLVPGESTILAMPDPQARRFLPDSATGYLDGGDAWEPTIAVALRFGSRLWDADLHGVFVNDSPVISWIADDGDRRGDGAPVLVVHSTPGLARTHLDDVSGALPDIVAATRRVLGLTADPVETYVHRWTFAKPSAPHEEPFFLDEQRRLGVCGDGWGGHSSVSAAWESGDALGTAFPLP